MTAKAGDIMVTAIQRAGREFEVMARGQHHCGECPILKGCPHQAVDQDWKDCPYPGGPIARKYFMESRLGKVIR